MRRILVTGAGGFIGRALCRALVDRGHTVLAGTRRPVDPIPGIQPVSIGSVGPQTDWSRHLDGVEIVVHLANRAHRTIRGSPAENEAETAAMLVRAAGVAGVWRLLYVSSIKAMGESTAPGAAFCCTDRPLPQNPYGKNKLETELRLRDAAGQTGVELVILRPPLVYGPGVKGNFRALLRLAGSGLPLPFAGIDNRRSLICLDNLVDLAALACIDPGAAGRVLLARDAADWSTPELVRFLAAALGRPARLFRVPPSTFATLRRFPGLGPLAERLTDSLQVDDRETRAALGWLPPIPPEIGLSETARSFGKRTRENPAM